MALEQQRSTNLGEQLRHTKDEARHVRGELSSIAAELRELFTMEAELAKAETDQAKAHATKGATFGAVAGILGLISGIFVFLTIMFGLNEVVELWLAALITTLIALALTGIAAMMARSELKQFSPMPKRFMHSLKEDMQWAKTQLRLNVR